MAKSAVHRCLYAVALALVCAGPMSASENLPPIAGGAPWAVTAYAEPVEMQDTTTLLALFLRDLRAGTLGSLQTITSLTTATVNVDTINLPKTTPTVVLVPEASGHFFQRNTTTAQRASWANNYASTISYEAFSIDWQSVANTALVGMRTSSTGTARRIFFESQADNAAGVYAGMSALAISNPAIRVGLYSSGGTSPSSTATITEVVRLGEFTQTATSGTITPVTILPTYNQASGTAANTDLSIARTETAVGSGTQYFINLLGGASATTQRAAIDSTGKFAVYGSVAVAGQGLEAIRAQATTGSVVNTGTASIATWTPGAADVEVEIGCRVNITVSTTHSFSCDVTYTDVANNARTRVLPMNPISGTPLATGLMTNTVGVGDFGSSVIRIGVKASTAITVRTSSGGTYTTVTYTASGTIKQVG